MIVAEAAHRAIFYTLSAELVGKNRYQHVASNVNILFIIVVVTDLTVGKQF